MPIEDGLPTIFYASISLNATEWDKIGTYSHEKQTFNTHACMCMCTCACNLLY